MRQGRQPQLYKVVMNSKGQMFKVPIKREAQTHKLYDGYVRNMEKGLYLKRGYEYEDKKNLDKC